MNKLTLFRADLISRTDVGTDEEVSTLLENIKNNVDNSNQKLNNDNCVRINNFPTPDWLQKHIDSLLNELLPLYSEDLIFSNLSSKEYDIYSWVNVNSTQSRNTMHSHIKAHFSCVYYLQGTGTGDLRLVNPANILGNCSPTAPWIRDVSYAPKDRDLIIWPAWVPHEVETNFSQTDRINLTADIIFRRNE